MRVSIRRTFNEAPQVLELPWGDPRSANPDSVVGLYAAWALTPMRGPTPTEKPHDLPLIGFCAFDQHDHKGAPGCRRGNMNPEGLWAIALDFDDADPVVFGRVLGNAQNMSAQGLVHTTWKHGIGRAPGTMGVIRARIVMPLLVRGVIDPFALAPHPMPADQWRAYWDAVTTALGAHEPGSGLDTQCANPERLWYLPCKNLDAPAWAGHLEVWG